MAINDGDEVGRNGGEGGGDDGGGNRGKDLGGFEEGGVREAIGFVLVGGPSLGEE